VLQYVAQVFQCPACAAHARPPDRLPAKVPRVLDFNTLTVTDRVK
jgi:hypothetical protein